MQNDELFQIGYCTVVTPAMLYKNFLKFTRNFFLATLTTYSRHLSENYFLRNKLETKAVPLATLHTDHTHVMVSKASWPQSPFTFTQSCQSQHHKLQEINFENITGMLVEQSLCTYTTYFCFLRCLYLSHRTPLSLSPRHASHREKPIDFFFQTVGLRVQSERATNIHLWFYLDSHHCRPPSLLSSHPSHILIKFNARRPLTT